MTKHTYTISKMNFFKEMETQRAFSLGGGGGGGGCGAGMVCRLPFVLVKFRTPIGIVVWNRCLFWGMGAADCMVFAPSQ